MRRNLLLLAAVLVACTLLYWPALHGPFLFDDFPNLAALTSIDQLNSWRDLGIYLSQPRSFPGRPLAMLSFLLQQSAWPGHPFPFKLVNLLIHLANGLLVYRLTWVLSRTWQLRGTNEATGILTVPGMAALFATAAWLLNPIQLSGVVLVVQRMNLLMALFVLLGLLAYLKGLLDEKLPSIQRGSWMLLGLGVCMGLAFLSKENGILLPLYALVLDATLLRASVARLPLRLRWWRRLLIWPVVMFVFAYVLYAAVAGWGEASSRTFTLAERLLTEPRILFDYLSKVFLPRFGEYGLFHDGYAVSHGFFSPWSTAPAMLLLSAAVVVALLVRKRWALFSFAVLWFVGGHIIESSSIMLELYFEHRNYLPIIGPFMALGIGLATIREPARKKLAVFTAVIWLAACSFALVLSANVFGSADRLAATWAQLQPESARAQSMLAARYVAHGRLNDAQTTVEAALATHPQHAGLAENLVYLKCLKTTLTEDDLQDLRRVLGVAQFNRQGFTAIETLRELANSAHCPPLDAAAWKAVVSTMLENPEFHNRIALGFLHYQLHEQAVVEGDLGAAVHELELAYKNDPNAEIPRLQAKYLASAGLYDAAIHTLQTTDYTKLPLLRRLLVDDQAINAAAIKILQEQKPHKPVNN